MVFFSNNFFLLLPVKGNRWLHTNTMRHGIGITFLLKKECDSSKNNMNTSKTIYLISEDEQLIRDCREAINSIDSSIVTRVSVSIEVFNTTIDQSGLSIPCIVVAEISSVKGFSEMEALLKIGSYHRIPVVLVSESFENGLEELTLNYGDMRYYTKPLTYKTVEFFFKELIADRFS